MLSQAQTFPATLPVPGTLPGGTTRSIAATLPVHSRAVVFTAADVVPIPWTIWSMVAGITMSLVGGAWDRAWHMSIGLDKFLTPPHILIGVGGLLVLMVGAYSIMTTSMASKASVRNTSIQVLGLHAPGGAFIAVWGSLAMLFSAPFDNWWHNAYGLDVQFITPPHALLSLGYFATKVGTMVWMAALINRSRQVKSRLATLFMVVGSICLVFLSLLIMPYTVRINMHTAACYLAVALVLPAMMIATARGAANKWGCTIVAAIYMGIGLASEWLIPLFPAQPKMGPVYHNVDHMVPLQFPLLLIVPAVIADLLFQKLEHKSSWMKAICVGPAFVLSFLAVQWPFASFLMAPASRNWMFGTAYFSYSDPAGFWYDPYQFRAAEPLGAFMLTLMAALAVSIVTTRFGLAWGDWMRRVRR